MLETWLWLRLSDEEEVDGVSQRVPGSGRRTPRKTGAAVEKQSRRSSSWKACPGLWPAEDAPALYPATRGASSPVCTEQSTWGVAGVGSAAGGVGAEVGWACELVVGAEGGAGGDARRVATLSPGSRASALDICADIWAAAGTPY